MELIQSKREELLAEYEKLGVPVLVNTLPYHSVKSIKFDVLQADTTNGFCWLRAAPQIVTLFDYGVGETFRLGADPQHRANESDTNMARGKSTNGAADCVIEGISLGACGYRIVYPEAYWDEFRASADDDIDAMLAGQAPVKDPGAMVLMPEVQSPANLEDSPAQLVLTHASLELEWDRRRTEKLGNTSQYPEGAANSYLRANGQPRVDNLWSIPEGYRWNRDGQPDSELLARIIVGEPLLASAHLLIPPAGEQYRAPSAVYLDIMARLHVFSVALPSGN